MGVHISLTKIFWGNSDNKDQNWNISISMPTIKISVSGFYYFYQKNWNATLDFVIMSSSRKNNFGVIQTGRITPIWPWFILSEKHPFLQKLGNYLVYCT